LRFALDVSVPHDTNEFPVSTLLANVLGAFVLGYVVARLWKAAPHWVRAGLGTGLLGSFTTFSAVMVSLITLGDNNEWLLALGYLGATVILGLVAAFTGLRLGAMRGNERATANPTESASADFTRPDFDRETE